METGIYGIYFELGDRLSPHGTLFFQNHKIIGHAYGHGKNGIKFDGSYIDNPETQNIEAKIKVTIPVGSDLIVGIAPKSHEQEFEFEIIFPKKTTETRFSIKANSIALEGGISLLRLL